MLSFQINIELERLLKLLDEDGYFFECLNKINSMFPKLNEYIQNIAEGGDKANNAANNFRSELAQARLKIGDVKPRNFFTSIDIIQKEIKKAKLNDTEDISQLNNIERRLNIFSQTYESYLESYSPQSAWKMIIEARALQEFLSGFKNCIIFHLANTEEKTTEFEDGQELSLILPSKMTLSEFIEKLKSIEIIYNEMCMLTGVSYNDHPIQIIKIESGSLWVNIFGNSKVIALLASLIESGAGYVYRNFTTEGKIVSIPRKVEALESVLKLSKKLEEQGIDVTNLNDHISKSSVTVAKELNRLISGQPQIVINDTKLSIGDEIQKKLIETKAPLKLEFDDNQE